VGSASVAVSLKRYPDTKQGLSAVWVSLAAVPGADSPEFRHESLFRGRTIEQQHAAIAAEGNEMQAALVLIADRFEVHSCRL